MDLVTACTTCTSAIETVIKIFGMGEENPALLSVARRQQTFFRPVSGADVLWSFLMVVVLPVAVGLLIIVASTTFNQSWLIGILLPVVALIAGIGLWLTLLRRGWTWRDLGFTRSHRSLWHLLWEVPLLWVLALILTIVVATLVGISPPETRSTTNVDTLKLGIVAALLAAICTTIVFPVLEEIVFRRLLFGLFEQRFGLVVAILGSAAVFALVHVMPVGLIQFFIGIGAAILVRLHRTLWAPIALHALNNGLATAAALTVLLG
ncbi:MAG: hypothetical protein CSA83_01610 [Actinomycetales bacterium]|nr:MAG: hypothetical protein CSA83_01610 [Actinomycetales bacterium]